MKVIRTDKNGNEIAEVSVTELDTMFKEIRAKAIDEFAEKIQWEYLNSCGLKQREIDFLVAASSMVAEQMKAGEIDG